MYTGNTDILSMSSIRSAVYPCVYREHFLSLIRDNGIAGLSLCIQGTQPHHETISSPDRFILVYTGNTATASLYHGYVPVYPCVYREHSINPNTRNTDAGLSLCIQGIRASFSFLMAIIRFIPVYTGNTRHIKRSPSIAQVYPCVYREH